MRYTYTILAFAVTALALPTAMPEHNAFGRIEPYKRAPDSYGTDRRSGYNDVPTDQAKRDDIYATEGRSGYNEVENKRDDVYSTEGRSGYNEAKTGQVKRDDGTYETEGRSGYNSVDA